VTAKDVQEINLDLYQVAEKPATLAAALAELQTKLPHVTKGEKANAGSYEYSYAGLGRVSKDLLPVMGALGLSFSCKPTINADGKFVLAYKLRHAGGEEDAGEWPLPSGSPQQIGSALTYGRRYTLLAITGLAPDGDDDDGKAAADTRVGSYEPESTPEQEDRADTFAEEIAAAEDADKITEIGGRVKRARGAKRITQTQYAKLSDLAAAKLATFPKPDPS
jgi:hypothetical protein